MKITNEILAAYAENKASKEEREQVRRYLIENPSKLESIIMMMDEDYELEPARQSINIVNVDSNVNTSFCVAAKCGTQQSVNSSNKEAMSIGQQKAEKMIENQRNVSSDSLSKNSTFDERLNDLLDELQ